jgi:hypothetical protein
MLLHPVSMLHIFGYFTPIRRSEFRESYIYYDVTRRFLNFCGIRTILLRQVMFHNISKRLET